MTIASSTHEIQYEGNGTTTVFPYTFLALDQEHLVVTHRDASGVETELTLTTDYTVSGVGEDAGGNVTLLGDAPEADEYLHIQRIMPLTQESALPPAGPFPPMTVERMADRNVMIAQQLDGFFERCIKAKTTTDISGVSLVLPDPVAGKGIKWNDGGTGLTNTLVNPDDAIGEIADMVAEAEAHKNAASGYATAALGAQGLAELAQGLAEDAQAAAEVAQTGAETAQAAAEEAVAVFGGVSGMATRAEGGNYNVQVEPGKITLGGAVYELLSQADINMGTILAASPGANRWYAWGFRVWSGAGDQLLDDFGYGQSAWVNRIDDDIYRLTSSQRWGGWYVMWQGPVFVGTGLDDLEIDFGREYTGTANKIYRIKTTFVIDQDYFSWSDDDGANWNSGGAITADWQDAGTEGLRVKFGAISTHTDTDYWRIWAFADRRRAVGFFRTDGSFNILPFETMAGMFRFHDPIIFLDTATPATSITPVTVDLPHHTRRWTIEINASATTTGGSSAAEYAAANGDETAIANRHKLFLAYYNYGAPATKVLLTNLDRQIQYVRSFLGATSSTLQLVLSALYLHDGMPRG